MKTMKWLTLVILVLSAGAFAEEESPKKKGRPSDTVAAHQIRDPQLGRFDVLITNKDHPVLLPLRITLSVTCNGKPTQILMDEEAICKYGGYKYDQATKTLTLEYYISTTIEGEGKCDTHVEQPVYMDYFCEKNSR